MPIYIELLNVIIPKEVINSKYKGGMEQFRKWFNENKGSRWQEDQEIFSI